MNHSIRPVLLVSLLVGSVATCALQPHSADAQVFPNQIELSTSVRVAELDTTAATHLERVKAFIAEAQWDEAVETLRQVLESNADKVVAVLPHRFINAADHCHLQISALPAPALELYRQRVDPLAQKLYDEAIASRDEHKLLTVVSQHFCSSVGDEALLALGDFALERGEAELARRQWARIIERPIEQLAMADFDTALARNGVTDEDRQLLGHWYQKDDAGQLYRLRHDVYLPDEPASDLVRFWKAVRVPASVLAYPGASVDMASVRARLILASVMEASLDRANAELEAFEHLHAGASGWLAGRDAKYAETLRLLIDAAQKWPQQKRPLGWPTFAGDLARQGNAVELGNVGAAAWAPIVLGEPLAADVSTSREVSARRVAEDIQALTSYHPIVYENLLLVSGDRQIFAFDIKTGKPAWPSSDPNKRPGEIFTDDGPPLPSSRVTRTLGVQRFTMTAGGGRLYARLGNQVTSRPVDTVESRGNYLVCLDLAAEGRLLWKIEPDVEDDRWSFEGAPIAVGNDVFVAMRRSDVRPQSHVACFNAETGERRWRVLVCSAETPSGGQVEEITHNLLTYHQGTIYLNTNLGAIAALRAESGQIQWLTLYPRAKRASSDSQEKRPAHFLRDLNPCIYSGGMLAVAPSDSEYLLGLDASTGQILWQNNTPDDVVHLLGASDGKLIASGDRLWRLELQTGNILHRWPDTTPLGFGRGLIADDEILWPTREAIHRLALSPKGDAAAASSREPIQLVPAGATGGNLLLTSDRLLITSPDKIFGFEHVTPQSNP